MSQILSRRLAVNLTKANLEKRDLDNLIQLILRYKKNQYIYPFVISRETSMSEESVYKCLLLLENSGYLKRYYEVGCLKCYNHNTRLYESIDEIPACFYCENCDEEKNAIKNSAVIFKVIDNG